MAVNWYIDEGLQVLKAQWLERFPTAVVYSVGDASHLEEGNKSQHNPEVAGSLPGQDAGEVDALDFMVGHGVTAADLMGLYHDLVDSRDPRIFYVIHNRKIVSSVTQPWVERPYTEDDPHIDHVHLSVNDKFDANRAKWDLEEDMPTPEEYAKAVIKEFRKTPEILSDTERIWIGKQVSAELAPQVATLLAAIQAIDVEDLSPESMAQLASTIVAGLPDDLAKRTVDELQARLSSSSAG